MRLIIPQGLALFMTTVMTALLLAPTGAAAQQRGNDHGSKKDQAVARADDQQGEQKVDRRTARRNARKKLREARRFRGVKVDGDTVNERVRQLAQLRWYSSLAKAKNAARQQKKLVLWIHALGRVDGFL